MEKHGDFFPENPESVEELLEQMAQRMAAMQAMLNSMTPEQRAQLQQLLRSAHGGHGSPVADAAARAEPAADVPADELGSVVRLRGPGPDGVRPGDADHAGARRARSARTLAAERHEPRPARRGRPRPRPRSARRRCGAITPAAGRAHEDARGRGPDREQGGADSSSRPVGSGRSDRTPCATCSRSSPRNTSVSTSSTSSVRGTNAPTRPSRTNSAIRSSSICTERSATPCAARGAARRSSCTPTTSRSSAPST